MTTTQYFVFVAITIEKVCMSDSNDDDTATGGSTQQYRSQWSSQPVQNK